MQSMVEGDKWEIYIPSRIAYGERGNPPKIPGNSVVIYTVELIKIIGEKVPALKCNFFTKEECNERETKWLNKIQTEFGDDHWGYIKEHVRLSKLKDKKIRAKPKKWLHTRIKLLVQYLEKHQ